MGYYRRKKREIAKRNVLHLHELAHAGVRNVTKRDLNHVSCIPTSFKSRCVIHLRELTHVEVFWTVQLGGSVFYWEKSNFLYIL